MKISPAVILYSVGLASALVLHHCSDKNEVAQAFYEGGHTTSKFMPLFISLEYTSGRLENTFSSFSKDGVWVINLAVPVLSNLMLPSY